MDSGETIHDVAETSQKMDCGFIHIEADGRRFTRDASFTIQSRGGSQATRVLSACQLQEELEGKEGRGKSGIPEVECHNDCRSVVAEDRVHGKGGKAKLHRIRPDEKRRRRNGRNGAGRGRGKERRYDRNHKGKYRRVKTERRRFR